MKVHLSDLKLVYEQEIRKNVKNKKKIFKFETQKIEYLLDIKRSCQKAGSLNLTSNYFSANTTFSSVSM